MRFGSTDGRERARQEFLRNFRCMATVGTAGDSRERGLEAVTRALSPGLLEGVNAGFLREDAHLVVVILGDEDDCSGIDGLPAPECSSDTLSEQQLRAYQCVWDADKLDPVEEVADLLKTLKKPPFRVMVASIVGEDDGGVYQCPREPLKSCTSPNGVATSVKITGRF
jgi:hypothetical protein